MKVGSGGFSLDMMPGTIPVFPLPGVLLLPRGQLPLNIFEPRYLAMVDDALKGDRIIGMIQPRDNGNLYETGCAGKITEFNETADGRYLITLTGLCRFKIDKEIEQANGYRRVVPGWSSFSHDFDEIACLDIDRVNMKKMLCEYFRMNGIECDMDAIDGVADERLITCLSMICHFDTGEKQALLESRCCRERAEKFMAIIGMAVRGGKCCGGGCH